MDFSPETIRARFHELTAKREEIDTVLMPLRNELDGLGSSTLSVVEAKAREVELRQQIRALQDTLVPVEMERATCARALGGKTGPRP